MDFSRNEKFQAKKEFINMHIIKNFKSNLHLKTSKTSILCHKKKDPNNILKYHSLISRS
jgi:hypothetical protein